MFSTNSLYTQFCVTYLCMTKLVLHGLIPPESSQASNKHPLKIEIVKTSVASCHEFFLAHLNEFWTIKLYNTISFSFVRCLDCLHNPHLLDSFRPLPVQRGFDQCPRRPLVRSVCHLAGLLQLSLWSTYLRLLEQARQGKNGSSLQEILQINFETNCDAYHQIDRTLAKYRTVKNAMTAKWIQNNEAQSDNAVCLPNWANGTDQHFQIDCTCCRTRQLNGSY